MTPPARAMTDSLNPFPSATSPFPSPNSFTSGSTSFFHSPTVPETNSSFPEDQGQGCPRILPAVEYSSLGVPRSSTPAVTTESGSMLDHHSAYNSSENGGGTPQSGSGAEHSNAPSPFQPSLHGLGIRMPMPSQSHTSEENDESLQATIRPPRASRRPHSFHGTPNEQQPESSQPQMAFHPAPTQASSAGPTRMSDVLGYPPGSMQHATEFRSASDSSQNGSHSPVKIDMPSGAALRNGPSDWQSRRDRFQMHPGQPYPMLVHPQAERMKIHHMQGEHQQALQHQQQVGWMMAGNAMAYAYQPYPVGYGANGEPVYAHAMSPERGESGDQGSVRQSWAQAGQHPYPPTSYNGHMSAYSPIESPYHLATPNSSMFYSSCDPQALQAQGQSSSSASSSYQQSSLGGSAFKMRQLASSNLYSPLMNGYGQPPQTPESNKPPGGQTFVKEEPYEGTPMRTISDVESDLTPEPEDSGSDYEPSPRFRMKTGLRQVSASSLQSSGSSNYRPRFRRPSSPVLAPLVSKRPRGRSVAIDPSHVNAKKTYMCDIGQCAEQPLYFGRREHLKRHMMGVHTNHKPFVCSHPSCGKAFSRSDNRNHHEKKVHGIYHR